MCGVVGKVKATFKRQGRMSRVAEPTSRRADQTVDLRLSARLPLELADADKRSSSGEVIDRSKEKVPGVSEKGGGEGFLGRHRPSARV